VAWSVPSGASVTSFGVLSPAATVAIVPSGAIFRIRWLNVSAK
jgi:hypothetical protein